MSIESKHFRSSRWWSPDTIQSTRPANAALRTFSSAACAIFGGSRNSTGRTIWTKPRYARRISSGVSYLDSFKRSLNLSFESVLNSSANNGSEEIRAICCSAPLHRISVGGPYHKNAEITTLVSNTAFTNGHFFLASCRRTSWTISQISSNVMGGFFEGVSALRFNSGYRTCFKSNSSSDWKTRKSFPLCRNDSNDFGKVMVRFLNDTRCIGRSGKRFLKKYTNKPFPGSTLGPDPVIELLTDNCQLLTFNSITF
jgi:hypothetical protein